MGEYADLTDEQGMSQWLHELDNFDDEGWMTGDTDYCRYTDYHYNKPKQKEVFEFGIKKILKETEKGILIKLDAGQMPGAEYWLPKNWIKITDNKVLIPKWLFDAKQQQAFNVMEKTDKESI